MGVCIWSICIFLLFLCTIIIWCDNAIVQYTIYPYTIIFAFMHLKLFLALQSFSLFSFPFSPIVENFLMANFLGSLSFLSWFFYYLSIGIVEKFAFSFFSYSCIKHRAAFSPSLSLSLCVCALLAFLFYWANPLCHSQLINLPRSCPWLLPSLPLSLPIWGVAFEPHDVVNCDSSIMSEIYGAL